MEPCRPGRGPDVAVRLPRIDAGLISAFKGRAHASIPWGRPRGAFRPSRKCARSDHGRRESDAPRRHARRPICAMWRDACRSFVPTYTTPAALNARPSQKNCVWYWATNASVPVAPSTGMMFAR